MVRKKLKSSQSENYCRLCAKRRESLDLISAFSVNGQSKLITTKIELIFNLKISNTDPLPQSVCSGCFKKLDDFYEFTKEVNESQKILKKLFSPTMPLLSDTNILNVDVTDKEEKIIPEQTNVPYKRPSTSEEEDSEVISVIEVLEDNEFIQHLDGNTHTRKDSNAYDEHFPEEYEFIMEVDEEEGNTSVTIKKSSKTMPVLTHDKVLGKVPKAYACEHCKKRYKKDSALNKHMEAAHKEVRWKCELCEDDFKYKSDLETHFKTMHGEREKTICKMCSAEVYDIQKHVQRNDDKNLNINCKICGKEFPNTECLGNHTQRLHANGKQYTCNFCNKPFSTKMSLKNHLREHTGLSPQQSCEFCTRTFSNTGNRIKHMFRMHYKDYIEWRKSNEGC